MVFPHAKEVEDIGLTNQPLLKKQNLSNYPESGGHDPLGVECQLCFFA
jgi:hypothetical protein